MVYAGIDLGTGSIKAAAFQNNQLIFSFSLPLSTHYPAPGRCEQDPEEVYQIFLQVLRELLAKVPNTPITIGFSAAMHSICLLGPDGNLLTPALLWSDQRANVHADNLRNSPLAEKLYCETGTPIHPMSPLCKLLWIQSETTWLQDKKVRILGIKEYIWLRLTGFFEIDYSLASATGLFEIRNLQWHPDALTLTQTDRTQFPDPQPTTFSRTVTFESSTIRFVIGASDGCLANLGSNVGTDTAAITVGTSGALRISSTKPISKFPEMPFSYILDEQTWIVGAPINNGGLALDWASNILGIETEALIELAAKCSPGAHGVRFLPYLTGERAPWWRSTLQASFHNLDVTHTRNDLARSVLEGITLPFFLILKLFESEGHTIKKIHASGGLAKSATWLQLLADITGKNVYSYADTDASVIGAAMLAARTWGVNLILPSETKTCDPVPINHQYYNQKLLPDFLHIYNLIYK